MTSVLLSLMLVLMAWLGLGMARGTSGRGGIFNIKDFSIVRTTLVVLIVPLMIWEMIVSWNEQVFWATFLGNILLGTGLLIRSIAQIHLKHAWSADLSLRQQHPLVQTGIYAFSRHPIYASYVFIAPGLFLSTGNVALGILSFCYTVVSLARIPGEDKLLNQRFEREYKDYRGRVATLVPGSLVVGLIVMLNIIGATTSLLVIF